MEKLFNSISIAFSFIGGLIISFLGGWDGLSISILALMIIDYITGVLKAIYTKKLSSEIGYKGILKKVAMLLAVGVTVFLENNMGIPAVREMVIMFFVANEGISILENISQMGVKIPEKLKQILLQLREKGE